MISQSFDEAAPDISCCGHSVLVDNIESVSEGHPEYAIRILLQRLGNVAHRCSTYMLKIVLVAKNVGFGVKGKKVSHMKSFHILVRGCHDGVSIVPKVDAIDHGSDSQRVVILEVKDPVFSLLRAPSGLALHEATSTMARFSYLERPSTRTVEKGRLERHDALVDVMILVAAGNDEVGMMAGVQPMA